MYKIYINGQPLSLCSPLDMAKGGVPRGDHLVARYTGKAKFLLNYIDLLEKGSPNVQEVTLFSDDVEQMWADFSSHFRLVEAAGGLVRNLAGECLLIFRRGHWDLPKGKLDKGESPAQAAVREVQEETGLSYLELGQPLPTSYHTYRDGKNRRVLKPTYWFAMRTTETTLQPQAEEDIEEAVWMDADSFLTEDQPIWPNIKDLLQLAQDL